MLPISEYTLLSNQDDDVFVITTQGKFTVFKSLLVTYRLTKHVLRLPSFSFGFRVVHFVPGYGPNRSSLSTQWCNTVSCCTFCDEALCESVRTFCRHQEGAVRY